MRIAFNTLVENPLRPTGAMVFFVKIIEEFARIDKNNKYYILVSPKNRSFFNVKQENFYYVNCFVSHERKILGMIISQFVIPFRLWQKKIDVYFSPQNIFPFIIPNRAKVVIYLYGTHHWQKTNLMGEFRTIYRNILSWLAKYQTAQFAANSLVCHRDIVENLNVPDSKVSIVPEALDHSLFNTVPLSSEEIIMLKKNDLEQKKYILFVSMIYYYKNVHTLVDAFAKLSKEFPELKLVLIGRNDLVNPKTKRYYENITNQITDNNLSKKIKFLGHIMHDKLPSFYKGAKLFIQPSFYETFGKTVIESMACGTPVIGSNTGATPEVIGESGLLFNPNSSDELYNKMNILCSDHLQYKYLAEKGIEHAARYTFTKQATKFIELFKNTLD